MRVALLQTSIIWNDPEQNMLHIDEVVNSSTPDFDLLLLPEMFTTGFAVDPSTAQADQGTALQWMLSLAARLDAAVAGSLMVNEDGHFYNRLYFVLPDGIVHAYDKRHLFAYGGEDRHYVPGTDRVIVNFRGIRFMLQVCYDLRFPVWSRYAEGCEYDALIYVANWPDSRREVWDTLTKARAIENQCYVLAVNRVGTDTVCEYSGGSRVISPYGKVVDEARNGEEQLLFAELDVERLAAFRQKFPVLQDRDPYTLYI